MGIFSFGKKDDAPRRRGADTGSTTTRRSSQNTRVERRSRRPDRTRDAEAMLLDPTLPEKQRARRRLVGAIALVLAAIVILPMVLDSHPKPVTDDIAIDIPSHPAPKNAARDDDVDSQAGVAPDNPAATGVATPDVAPGASGLAAANVANTANQNTQTAQASPSAQTASSKPAPAAQAQTQPNSTNSATQTAQAPKAAAKPAQPAAPATTLASRSKPAATDNTSDDSADGDAATPATPPGARFAVQLGAFPDAAAANRWVAKLKAAGVPAYTEQRKDTDGTTRTLLRAGPFPDRAAASEAIAKVRGAGLASGSNGNAE